MRRNLPVFVPLLLTLIWIPLACPVTVTGQTTTDTPASQFNEVANLRVQEQYDEAIEALDHIITGATQPEEVIRRAYAELIFTHLSREDTTAAEESARQALKRFPNLRIDPLYIPSTVGDLLSRLRAQMFGSLILTTQPDSCRAELDGVIAGFSPLVFEYLAAGNHTLQLTKTGYNDLAANVTIEPNTKTGMHYALEKHVDQSLSSGDRTGTTLGAGFTNPRGEAGNVTETGVLISGGGWFVIPRTRWFLGQWTVQGLFYGTKDGPRVGEGESQYQVTSGMNVLKTALTVEAFKNMGTFEPHIGAGGGLSFVFTRSELVDEDGNDGHKANKTDGHISATASAGCRVYFTSRTAVDLSLQYDWSRNVKMPDLHPDVPSRSFDLQSFSIVVSIYLGRT